MFGYSNIPAINSSIRKEGWSVRVEYETEEMVHICPACTKRIKIIDSDESTPWWNR